MRKRGYTFVTLDEATKDPAYSRAEHLCGLGVARGWNGRREDHGKEDQRSLAPHAAVDHGPAASCEVMAHVA